jgi:hypothetical protein
MSVAHDRAKGEGGIGIVEVFVVTSQEIHAFSTCQREGP